MNKYLDEQTKIKERKKEELMRLNKEDEGREEKRLQRERQELQ